MVRKSYSAARFTHISSGRKPSAQPGEHPASARWKTGLRSAPSRLPRELYASVMHISETEKFEVCLIAREQSLSAHLHATKGAGVLSQSKKNKDDVRHAILEIVGSIAFDSRRQLHLYCECSCECIRPENYSHI